MYPANINQKILKWCNISNILDLSILLPDWESYPSLYHSFSSEDIHKWMLGCQKNVKYDQNTIWDLRERIGDERIITFHKPSVEKLLENKIFSLELLEELCQRFDIYRYYFAHINTFHWLLSHWGENTFQFLAQYHPNLIKFYFKYFRQSIILLIKDMPINPYFNLSTSVIKYMLQDNLDTPVNSYSCIEILENYAFIRSNIQNLVNINFHQLLKAHRIYLPDYQVEYKQYSLFQRNKIIIVGYQI